jgi:RHS repeat-associated protein
VLSQQGSYPYGEQWYQSGPGNKWFFTSYGRDSETGLDYALARYYDSRTGTFCSADPLAGSPSDPQSWNRYPYGRNNPIMVTDPSGQFWLFSLIQDVAFAAAFFTGGATLPFAFGAGVENTFYDIANGQVPNPISFSVGGSSGGAWTPASGGSTSSTRVRSPPPGRCMSS